MDGYQLWGIKTTTTMAEFVEGEALEETIVSNCPKYRKKFLRIIEKAENRDADIEDQKSDKKNFSDPILELGRFLPRFLLGNL